MAPDSFSSSSGWCVKKITGGPVAAQKVSISGRQSLMIDSTLFGFGKPKASAAAAARWRCRASI